IADAGGWRFLLRIPDPSARTGLRERIHRSTLSDLNDATSEAQRVLDKLAHRAGDAIERDLPVAVAIASPTDLPPATRAAHRRRGPRVVDAIDKYLAHQLEIRGTGLKQQRRIRVTLERLAQHAEHVAELSIETGRAWLQNRRDAGASPVTLKHEVTIA